MPEQIDDVVVSGRSVTPFAPARAEIGVLGNRTLEDIPFSIVRFEQSLLQKQQVRDLADVLRNDASTQVQTTASSYASTVTIRGFDVSNYYFDGLTGPIASQPVFPVELIESVDVFKGPSSVLFGGGSAFGGVGGAVNFVPKRPPVAGRIAEATIGYQNRGLAFGSVDIGERFGSDDKFGYRLVVTGEIGERTIRQNDAEEYLVAGSFDWRASDALTLTLDLGHFRSENRGYLDTPVVPAFPLPDAPDPTVNFAPRWNYYGVDTDYVLLRADVALAEGWSLEAAGGYTRNRQPYAGGATNTILNRAGDIDVAPAYYDPEPGDYYSARTSLRGRFDTGGLKHDLTVSGRYDRNNEGGPFGSYAGGPFRSNIYRPSDIPEPPRLAPDGSFFSEFETVTLQATDFVEVHPMLTLVGGVGYVQLTDVLADVDGEAVTPIGGLVFRPFDHTSVYGGYAEAIQRGGVAPIGTANQFEQLSPIVSDQWEVGIRQRIGEVNVSLAYFELARTLEFVDASNVYVQDGEQRHQGLELTGGGDITPDLSLFASAAYIETEIENDSPDSGNNAPGVPRTSLRVFGEYRVPAVRGLALNAGFNYRSSQYANTGNTYSIPDYYTIDLGASYDLKPAHDIDAIVRLNVDNVLDEHYWSSISFGGFGVAIGEPLTVRLSLTYRF